MSDMWFVICAVSALVFICCMTIFIVMGRVEEESRRWRRLIQLYLEKQAHAPLPIDEDPNAPAESVLSLPDEEMDEIERQLREEEEALRLRQ